MMQATLTSALEEVGFSAAERAERLSRLHFVAAASLDALRASGGALVSAMLEAWPSYWNAVQAEAPAGANSRRQPCFVSSSCFSFHSAAWVLQCTSAALQSHCSHCIAFLRRACMESVWPTCQWSVCQPESREQ